MVLHGAVGGVGALGGLGHGARRRGPGPGERDARAEDVAPEPGGHEDGLLRDEGVGVGGAVAEAVDEDLAEAVGRELDADGGELVTDPW